MIPRILVSAVVTLPSRLQCSATSHFAFGSCSSSLAATVQLRSSSIACLRSAMSNASHKAGDASRSKRHNSSKPAELPFLEQHDRIALPALHLAGTGHDLLTIDFGGSGEVIQQRGGRGQPLKLDYPLFPMLFPFCLALRDYRFALGVLSREPRGELQIVQVPERR